MKLYEYEELRKLNQALNSFKRNEVPVLEVKLLTIDNKVNYFVLTDPKYKLKPEKEVKKPVKKEKKEKEKEKKKEVKKEKK